MSCGLLGLGIVAPAAQDCGALMDILAGPGSGSFAVSAIRRPAGFPAWSAWPWPPLARP